MRNDAHLDSISILLQSVVQPGQQHRRLGLLKAVTMVTENQDRARERETYREYMRSLCIGRQCMMGSVVFTSSSGIGSGTQSSRRSGGEGRREKVIGHLRSLSGRQKPTGSK